ncbi:hypothetical protein MHD_08805 [Mannheimia granulomatis]|uniref:Putative glucose-6-phosphate 1-epimerase n=1 Tax=Mannheimia granulomatis TaxID=85402 RepID=A0A011LVX0_9PAST|nr:D-hexose-6-phosphate mutarotase [Mannheimia granulomatis]EXI61368.1 aldose 1-epimerase [Mannheimia granulomatis]RGE47591.1 hypothetical protein MHD_08805 [Mannheimia granulomatis]
MSINLIKSISKELNLMQYNQLSVLEINHPKVKAKIALQGAQLLSWQPYNTAHDVLWLSEIEPFQKEVAIRGGVPICHPWFGTVKVPAHGTSRIQEWCLTEYSVASDSVSLVFTLAGEAKIEMILGEICELNFTHLGKEPAQAALHTYFNIADIEQLEVNGLPTRCFDKLTNQEVSVPSPRIIRENVDCLYAAEPINRIQDMGHNRTIVVEHINATETVLWNPWHKQTNGMSEHAYRNMVCVETARLSRLLEQNGTMGVRISVR